MPQPLRFRARRWMCPAALALAASCERSVVLTPRVGSLEVVDTPASLPVGETVVLNAVVRDASGERLDDKKVYWGAVDTTIVRVDSLTGMARARAPGATKIVASSEDKHKLIDIVVPHGPFIALDSIVNDELGPTDDADEFRFVTPPGQQVNVLLRGLSGSATHKFRLRLIGPGGNLIDSITSRGNDLELRLQAIKWLPLAQGGEYRVRVDGNLGADKGTYQFMVQSIDPEPETARAEIAPGTVVANESLSPGDIDNFKFAGTVGQEISILFRARSGMARDALRLRLLAPNGGEVVFVQSNGDYPTSQPSGRLQFTQGGNYIVRVQGVDAEDQGAYQFQVVNINRGPEQAAVTVLGDSVVSGETIGPMGDVDEFLFTAATNQEVNVYLQSRTGLLADTMVLRVLGPTNARLDSVRSIANALTLEGQAISHLKLSAATYRLQVEGSKHTEGGYKFIVRPINLAPEVAPAAYSLGSSVTSERISPVGDVDQFTFFGTKGAVLRITFQATSRSSSDELGLYLLLPNGTQHVFLPATGAQTEQILNTTLPEPGNYLIRIQGMNSSNDAGPYRFQVTKMN
jgi:hypothetical protein